MNGKRVFEWAGGFLAATFTVGFLNIFAGLGALAIQFAPVSGVVGAAPGIIVAFVLSRLQKSDMTQGAMVATCILALFGGICGYDLGSKGRWN